jgi:hypothetical protein
VALDFEAYPYAASPNTIFEGGKPTFVHALYAATAFASGWVEFLQPSCMGALGPGLDDALQEISAVPKRKSWEMKGLTLPDIVVHH